MGGGGAKDHMEVSPASKKELPQSQLPSLPTDMDRVQRKWQMASIAHFFEVFKDTIPLREISPDTAEDLTPALLETAIVEPDLDTAACIALRDIIMCMLLVIGPVTKKNLHNNWFQSLRIIVDGRPHEFMDCFPEGKNLLHSFENGMDFLASVQWNVRLGLLLSMCDIAAEESSLIREALKDSESASSATKNEIEARGYRLKPLGRCSQRRFHYKIGKTRIYSGYKRKGSGTVLVECTDSGTMQQFAEALDGSPHPRDKTLSMDIKQKYLQPLLELEERGRRKIERKRLAEIQREESRRRNSSRPRRSKASYS